MDTKSFLGTLGIGMVAGAAVTLMIPKKSKVYRTANDAANAIKRGVSDLIDQMDFA